MSKRWGIVLLTAALAGGQTLDTRILLPDSFGVLGITPGAVCDTIHGKVYYAGVGAIGVLGGADGRRVGRIEVAGAANPYVHGLHWNPASRRLYSVPGLDTLISVIETETDSVVATMAMPHPLIALDGVRNACLNTRRNKLYVVTYSGKCAVFDLSTNTLQRVLPVSGWTCYDAASDKLYMLVDDNQVSIFDGNADSLLTTVQAGNGATNLRCLERCNRVYVTNFFGASVTVIDGASNGVIRDIPTPVGPLNLTMNETDGKVYVSCDGAYAVIDGYGDSVRAVVPVNGTRMGAAAATWNARTDKAYLVGANQLKVVAGASDTVVKELNTAFSVDGAVCNSCRNAVYFTRPGTSRLTAINGASDTIMWREFTGRDADGGAVWSSRYRRLYNSNYVQGDITVSGIHPFRPPRCMPEIGSRRMPLNLSPEQDRLYVASDLSSVVQVVSCSLERVIDSILLPGQARYSAVMAPLHRLYQSVCLPGESTGALVIASTDSDTVVRTISADPASSLTNLGIYAFSESSRKVYWPSAESVLVINAATDSLLHSIRVVSSGHVYAMCWVPSLNRVYVATQRGTLLAVDCSADSIVAAIPVPTMTSLCYSPTSGKLYGLGMNSGRLTVVDCGRNRVVGYISVPLGVDHVAPVFNLKGNKVFFAASSQSAQSEVGKPWFVVGVDCATDLISAWVGVGARPNSLVVDPDSGFVFALCENSAIYVVRDQMPGGLSAGLRQRTNRASLDAKPNPTIAGIVISACLPARTPLRVRIYDVTGKAILTLADENEAGPGTLQIWWDGTSGGGRLPAGTYLVKLEAGKDTLTTKVVLAR
jgi:YVTN family beta-propeller protein